MKLKANAPFKKDDVIHFSVGFEATLMANTTIERANGIGMPQAKPEVEAKPRIKISAGASEHRVESTRRMKGFGVERALVPRRPQLSQNYPNPFNPETWMPYQLTEPADVTIQIYDANGQRVRTLNMGLKPSGFYLERGKAAYWDGRNDAGEPGASGIYFYSIKAGTFSDTRKMLIRK
ncbi:T9SS type A sorting domain-containing protein [Candidatus Poribacteria bacterium]|nr:T9SS type A sorting domain-containing protein [Candidatus Poribacteria bacterium]